MEIPTTVDFVGFGVVSLAKLDSSLNRITPFRAIGNVPGFSIKHELDKGSARESMSGVNVKTSEWVNGTDVNYSMEVSNFVAATYEMFCAGTHTPKTSVTPITGRTLEGGSVALAVGDRFDLGAMNVSAVTIKDSTGSPKTLTADTNYKLDAASGVATIINIATGGPFVTPLTADLTPGAYDEVEAMTTYGSNYALMFEGKNKTNGKVEKRILGNVTLPPVSEIQFIGTERATATIEGAVLKDKNGKFYILNLQP